MQRLFVLLVVLCAFALSGCACNRSDFVCGANGQAKDDVSDTGKAIGNVVRSGGPNFRLSY
jgi:hypothetical protein